MKKQNQKILRCKQKIDSKTEKRIIIKSHISKILYSKEEIEIIINYSGNGAENSPPPTLPADFFCPHPKKSRRELPDNNGRENFCAETVCKEKTLGPVGFEPTTCRL
jgi:hypothetical protein